MLGSYNISLYESTTRKHRRPVFVVFSVLLVALILTIALLGGEGSTGAEAAPVCGQWSVMPAAGPAAKDSLLAAVSATSPDDVWAVGSTHPLQAQSDQTLVLHWDGNNWSVVPSPNPNQGNNHLDGVLALSPTNAWTVGDAGMPQHPTSIVLHWDGTIWAPATLPLINDSGNALYAISGVSPNDIWAVGVSGNFDIYGPATGLIMHYDGSSWIIAAALQNDQGQHSVLYGVAARATNDAWAVGTTNQGDRKEALTVHWDGTKWQKAETKPPNTPGYETKLYGIAFVNSTNVWAVGNYASWHATETVTQHFDGSSWNRVDSPSDVAYLPGLTGIAVENDHNIWAVGAGATGAKGGQPLAVTLHWDGNIWAAAPNPQLRAYPNNLL